ncbi:hypothetical protein ASE67_16120 [Sphingomonas sp. Leaf23]|uniref:hypothetical protein n=1 Tax=Sphingomonas sp. Leaf23 TaxID=1735689 RepID=UPI0006FD43B3|nr:hypothetical protein [Sphingomonas sp. Leaf23]KQM81751.1 hypothetical protein ASE67_16120 [Sphingomonas sp. Leaf23]
MTGRIPRIARVAAELAVGFGALVVIDRVVGHGNAFADIQPNPLWLPVLVMALAYGTLPALAAAGIASGLWLLHAGSGGGERDYLDHLLHLSLPPLLWFVAAVIVGEVTILRVGRYRLLDRRAGIAQRNVARLTDAFHRLARTNRALQVEVATDARTLGYIVATATRLSAIEPTERRAALAALIAMAARSEDFTCYRFAGAEARAWLRGATAMTRPDILPDALAMQVLRRSEPIHVGHRTDRVVLDGIGVIAIPLIERDGGSVVGCLVIHSLPFAALGANALAEMAEMGGWLAPLIAARERSAATMVAPSGRAA